ncbi:hypothetical protein SNE40_019272 [Patella caerulea]|uniref:Uncharacterized protein n=1 Tax=Patella caerulea TaxID=87958 RepID=A0AAN8J897_PATCE
MACSEAYTYYDKYLKECSHCATICDDAEQRGNLADCKSRCQDYLESLQLSIAEHEKTSNSNGESQTIVIPIIALGLVIVLALALVFFHRKKISGCWTRRIVPNPRTTIDEVGELYDSENPAAESESFNLTHNKTHTDEIAMSDLHVCIARAIDTESGGFLTSKI